MGVPNVSPHDITHAVSPEAHYTTNTTASTASPGYGTQQTHTQRTLRPARTTPHTPQPHARLQHTRHHGSLHEIEGQRGTDRRRTGYTL